MSRILLVLFIYSFTEISTPYRIREDEQLTVPEIGRKYGQKTEEHDVTTEDGYILKMYRFIGNKSKPVLMVHGAIDSSATFVMRGNTSLGVALARQDFDVWMINLRGNRHSRRHVKLNPDVDAAYWDFSMQELGYYDVAAAIDFVLNATGQHKLRAIGYSEGTTAFYVLGATRPEYNDKLIVCISLAPICYMHDIGFMSTLIGITPLLDSVYKSAGINEIVGPRSASRQAIEVICNQRDLQLSYDICMGLGLFLISGYNLENIEPEFLPVIIGHFPAGTSRKNVYHLAQIGLSRRFAMYDYGPKKNLKVYKSKIPPEYDLNKVTMKSALFVAKNDQISTLKNVSLLKKRLPNVVEYRVMTPDAFNHIDYVWGRDTHKTMHPQILEILNKYK